MIAIVDMAQLSSRSQANVVDAAHAIMPGAPAHWPSVAVKAFEMRDLVHNVSRGLGGELVLTVSAEAFKAADAIKAEVAAAQATPPKMGY